MNIPYRKYHALQNDFVVVDRADAPTRNRDLSILARSMCARQTGIGADGLLLVAQNAGQVPVVTIVNADGSVAEMSGNGLRIAGLYLHERLRRRKQLQINMGGKIHQVNIGRLSSRGVLIAGEIPPPSFETESLPMRSDRSHHINHPLKLGAVSFPVTCLSVGNPHCVLFVANFDFDWKQIGHEIENHKLFPNRTNVEFVRVVSKRRMEVRFWERGVGETGSSGTGSSAALCAGVILGVFDRTCRVKTTSGELTVSWPAEGESVRLEGPVTRVCEGVFFHS